MSRWVDSLRVWLPHLLLYAATALYGIFGAVVFHRVELPFETEHLQRHSIAIAEAQDALFRVRPDVKADLKTLDVGVWNSSAVPGFNDSVNIAIDALIRVSMDAFSEGIRASDLSAMFGVLATSPPVADDNDVSSEAARLLRVIAARIRPKWNFHSSLFFTTTLLTSIGYGNLVPISPFGRIFCICYAFLGIPLTLITIADLAKFFADLLVRLPVMARSLLERIQWSDAADDDDDYAAMDAEMARRQRIGRENLLNGSMLRRASRSGGITSGRRRMTLGDIQYRQRDDEEEESDAMMSEPGFWTKNFVLALLFAYMALMAFIFTMLQTNWNFLDAFYFCLITLVTIGFGDFCPVEESHYGGWIAFILVGLILSTLTVDLVGSATIERIHTLGRGLDLGSLLTMLGKSGNDSTRLLQQLYAEAYQPCDLHLIPYIDQMTNGASPRSNNKIIVRPSDKYCSNVNGKGNGNRIIGGCYDSNKNNRATELRTRRHTTDGDTEILLREAQEWSRDASARSRSHILRADTLAADFSKD